MGIRGLSTFFNNNPDLSKPHKLFDTPVIIDGNNLIHLLYFRSKVDCVYGGDYNRYAAAVRKYFSPFLECNIRPIIIFDGGYDKSNKKFKTVLMRSRTRLTITNHIAKYGECAGNVLPINCLEVFRGVLAEMGIPFAQCDFEADDQITALANLYDCPVLSNDSDFYIFDVRKGFVTLSSLEAVAVEDNGVKYLKCDIYHIDRFLSHFPGIHRGVLPLFGTLIGNDFANGKSFENFFSNIQLPKPKCKGLKVNPNQRRIVGLLKWLTNFTLEEGIEQVLVHLKKKLRDDLKSIIDRSVESYRTEECILTHVIEGDLDTLRETLKADGKMMTECGEALPIPFVVSFHAGSLPSLFLNVINLHRTFLPAQVENVSLESSYACSRYIRRVIYGLLLKHPASNSDLHGEVCCRPVEEFDRRNGSFARQSVSPIFTFRNGDPLPDLCDVYDMDKTSLQRVVSLILDAETPQVPCDLQLLFACMNYWLKNCLLKPREEFVNALVVNLIYFSYVLKPLDRNKNDRSASELDADFSISKEDAVATAENMKKYLKKPVFNNGNPIILHILHCYSELQTCILYSVYLNSLLGLPYENPKLNECFSGTLIYNLTKKIMSRPNPDLFVEELLGRKSGLIDVFTSMKTKILGNVSTELFERIDRSEFGKSKKKKSNKKSKGPVMERNYGHENTLPVHNELEHLSTEDLCMVDSVDIYI